MIAEKGAAAKVEDCFWAKGCVYFEAKVYLTKIFVMTKTLVLDSLFGWLTNLLACQRLLVDLSSIFLPIWRTHGTQNGA
jgi:hypothetical protein